MARRLAHRLLLASLLFLLTTSFVPLGGELVDPPHARPTQFRVTHHFAGGLEYYVAEPRELAADAPLPMIVYLHGRSSRPTPPSNAFLGVTLPVRVVMPRAPQPEGNGYSWMPVSAHDGESRPLREAIETRVETLRHAIDAWTERHPTQGKPILVGFSQGAILATTLAMRHPHAVTAAMTVATWLPPSFEPRTRDPLATQVPIHALHGTHDPVLSASRTRLLFERLSRLGYPVTFEQYPDTRHEVSNEMRERMRELIEGAIHGLPAVERTSGNS